jgi:RecA-family ATPase
LAGVSVMVGGITAAELDDIDIAELSWMVPGLIPEGFGILAAAPKIGKSWLVLSLGLAVAMGAPFLGVPVEQRPVLYLALEDGKRPMLYKLIDSSSIRRVKIGRRAFITQASIVEFIASLTAA